MIGGSTIVRGSLTLVTLAALFVAAAAADDATPPPNAITLDQALVPELALPAGMIMPGQPVRVRFLLQNRTDEAVQIPLAQPSANAAGIILPDCLVFGTDAQPALRLIYEGESPTTLRPLSGSTEEPVAVNSESFLVLGPHAVIGTEMDIQPIHRTLRYAGSHKLIWRPLDGHVGEASVSFRIDPRQDAVLVTDYGKITFKLNYDQAPLNVANFLDLVRSGFYDGMPIHLIAAGVALQAGRPEGDGSGARPDGKTVPAEFGHIPFEAGTLGMAIKPSDPDSASCQFFVTLARAPQFDGSYTIVGQARDEESLRTLTRLGE
ncbi:MAG: peptidylprolyl isomerase, partial [Phycisphaerae bacterium]|nr:peptidylprolyl isomerase [Phycisphaerae bacterium]